MLAWGALLTVLAGVLFAWTPDAWLQWTPFAAAALLAWAIGLAQLRRRRAARPDAFVRCSGAALAFAVGVGLTGNALVYGWWLALVGGATALLAMVALVREAR